jgi:hypothetical protein
MADGQFEALGKKWRGCKKLRGVEKSRCQKTCLTKITDLQDKMHLMKDTWYEDENFREENFYPFKIFDDLNWLQKAVLDHTDDNFFIIAGSQKFQELINDWEACKKEMKPR